MPIFVHLYPLRIGLTAPLLLAKMRLKDFLAGQKTQDYIQTLQPTLKVRRLAEVSKRIT